VGENDGRKIVSYDVDVNGNPSKPTRKAFLQSASGDYPYGSFFDPLTGDLLVITYLSPQLIVVKGFAPIPLPTITSFSPTTGPIGTTVKVTGQNFTVGMVVNINGKRATTKIVSPTQFKVKIPSTATSGPISVLDAGVPEQFSPGAFTITP
jgi:hypothetical protein